MTLKILFSVAMIINFFVAMLNEKRDNLQTVSAVVAFLLFVIIVSNRAFLKKGLTNSFFLAIM